MGAKTQVLVSVDLFPGIIQVDNALGRCGYPNWSFQRVRDSMDKKKKEGGAKKTKEDSDRYTKTTVTIPYVQTGFGSPEPGVLLSWCSNSHEASDTQEDAGTP